MQGKKNKGKQREGGSREEGHPLENSSSNIDHTTNTNQNNSGGSNSGGGGVCATDGDNDKGSSHTAVVPPLKSTTTTITTTTTTTTAAAAAAATTTTDSDGQAEGSTMSQKAGEQEGVQSDGGGCRIGEGDDDEDDDDDDDEMVEEAADGGVEEEKGRAEWAPSFLVYASSSGGAASAGAVATSAVATSSLTFPPSFAQRYLKGCTGDIQLEGPSGWVWPCPFQRDDDSMLLVGPGWEEFSRDHELKEADALLFTLVGRNLFKVRMFQLGDGMERGRDCFPSSIRVLRSSHPSSTPQIDKDVDPHAKAAGDEDDVVFQQDSIAPNNNVNHLDVQSNDPNHASRSNAPNNTKNSDVQSNAPTIINRSSLDESQVFEKRSNGQHNSCNARTCSMNCKMSEGGQIGEQARNMEARERAKHIHDTITRRIENPSVTKLLNATSIHKSKLVFPTTFVKRYMPDKIAIITLEDCAGKKWKCRWLGEKRLRDGVCVCGGWALFVKAHNLKVNDVCIFELVNIETLEFKVQIFKS